jgi:hypothetical protein
MVAEIFLDRVRAAVCRAWGIQHFCASADSPSMKLFPGSRQFLGQI